MNESKYAGNGKLIDHVHLHLLFVHAVSVRDPDAITVQPVSIMIVSVAVNLSVKVSIQGNQARPKLWGIEFRATPMVYMTLDVK